MYAILIANNAVVAKRCYVSYRECYAARALPRAYVAMSYLYHRLCINSVFGLLV